MCEVYPPTTTNTTTVGQFKRERILFRLKTWSSRQKWHNIYKQKRWPCATPSEFVWQKTQWSSSNTSAASSGAVSSQMQACVCWKFFISTTKYSCYETVTPNRTSTYKWLNNVSFWFCKCTNILDQVVEEQGLHLFYTSPQAPIQLRI